MRYVTLLHAREAEATRFEGKGQNERGFDCMRTNPAIRKIII
jgi:hypothetical protein